MYLLYQVHKNVLRISAQSLMPFKGRGDQEDILQASAELAPSLLMCSVLESLQAHQSPVEVDIHGVHAKDPDLVQDGCIIITCEDQ